MARIATRLAALNVARTQLGVREHGRNNWGPQVARYLAGVGITAPAAWCMAFVHWCFARAGISLGGFASVGNFVTWAATEPKAHIVSRPFRGDIVAFFFDGDDWPDHAGIVERVLSIRYARMWYLQTIEGNTGPHGAVSDPGTGRDAVRRKRRLVRRSRVVFVRIHGTTAQV